MDTQARRRSSLLFVASTLLCIVLYLPGLKGGYLFDDYPNIVDNPAIHLTTLDAASLQRAFWATPSSGSQRPLATLSYALNHYFTGLATQPMKVTNLAIHAINGWLLYLLLSNILRFSACSTTAGNITRARWLAALVAGAWLLHPINLSAVLFIVQRMESLAQLFVLLGLLLYVDARTKRNENSPLLWFGFPVCLLLGMGAKESAVLLPLYAFLLECIIFRKTLGWRREQTIFHTVFLLIPLVAGLAWILPGVLSPSAFSTRHFTLVERLLTEPRVLADYAIWTALPIPQFSSFYHDDYPVSTGLFSPWATLPAIIALIAAIVAAWKVRRSRPLISLGLSWFFAAHALTATIIPLELVFEHRNYFASVGLLLVLFDLLLPAEKTQAGAGLGKALILVMFALAAFTLNIKARTWGNPVLFAVAEAVNSPDSPRATYELGRTYALLSNFRADSLNLAQAIAALEIAAAVPRASAMPESSLIIASSKSGVPVKPGWWQSLTEKLTSRPLTPEDVAAIRALTECRRGGGCAENDEMLEKIYRIALDQRRSPELLYAFAIHAHNVMKDPELSLSLVREAAKSDDLQYQVNLIELLADLGLKDEAQAELESLILRDRKGALRIEADALRMRLDSEK